MDFGVCVLKASVNPAVTHKLMNVLVTLVYMETAQMISVDTCVSVTLVGLEQTVKWKRMHVCQTRARMEEFVTVWWMDTDVPAGKDSKA